MKYIIMCGGNYPVWKKPRHLLPFLGEPIVARTIRLLRENGIEDIAISTNRMDFGELGVPVIKHYNDYDAVAYNRSRGNWCDCFFLSDNPTCYLFGDVVFSEAAIHKIVDYETDDIMLFGSKPPFHQDYPKRWIEPFAFKAQDIDHLYWAVEDVKKLDKAGRFRRRPIAWEVWNVITRGPDGDVNTIDYSSYEAINDWTCDIDKPEEIPILEKIAERRQNHEL